MKNNFDIIVSLFFLIGSLVFTIDSLLYIKEYRDGVEDLKDKQNHILFYAMGSFAWLIGCLIRVYWLF